MADSTDARVQEMERSVESLESQVRAQIARTQAGARAVLIIGIILIIAIFGYMTWIGGYAQKVFEPEGLVDMMEEHVQARIPEYVGKLEAALNEQAETNVAAVRKMVVSQVPVVVQKAQGLADGAIDKLVGELETKVSDVVAEVLELKQTELTPLIEAASDAENQEQLKAAFEKSMEEIVADRLDDVMLKFDRTMIVLNARLDKFNQSNDKLTTDEVAVKELIVTLLYFIDDAVRTGSVAEAAESAMSTAL